MEVAPVAQIFRPLTYSTKPRNPSRVANTSVSFLAQSPLVNSEGELGRSTFLQDLTSPWYRERWLKEVPNKQTVDKIINTMHSSAESAPFDYSKTASELGGNWGVTKRNKPRTESIYDKDGNVIWQVINNDTGMAGIDIASNDPEKAKTAYHELLHYTTNNTEGLKPNPYLVVPNDMFSHAYFKYPALHQSSTQGGKLFQDFIIDQNERQLPKRDPIYSLIWDTPDKAKSLLVSQGYTPESAENWINGMKNDSKYMWSTQEQRAHLRTWFKDKIQQNIENPNNAEEIEQYLNENPDIIEKASSDVKQVVKELRSGSIKDYAKYFSTALSSLPIISVLDQ